MNLIRGSGCRAFPDSRLASGIPVHLNSFVPNMMGSVQGKEGGKGGRRAEEKEQWGARTIIMLRQQKCFLQYMFALNRSRGPA